MDWPIIDLIIRFMAISNLILLIIILWRDHNKTLPAKLGMVLCIGVISYFIFEIPESDFNITPINLVLCAAMSSIYTIFWLFSRSWFNDEAHIGWKSWSIVFVTTIISVVLWMARVSGYDQGVNIPTRVIWMGFSIWGLWIAWQGKDNDLVEVRRKLRTLFIVTVGSSIGLITVIFFIYNLFLKMITPYLITISVNAIILIITYYLIISLVRSYPVDLFAPIEKPNSDSEDNISEEELALQEKLENYISYERAYRNESLTISVLANTLDEQEYKLRRLINGRLGYRNFSSFLNHYRLSEVKEALSDIKQAEVPILTIALDSGFGSLAPFNRAFREAEGMTPTQYRQVNLRSA